VASVSFNPAIIGWICRDPSDRFLVGNSSAQQRRIHTVLKDGKNAFHTSSVALPENL
jgi:hypothetical protein